MNQWKSDQVTVWENYFRS